MKSSTRKARPRKAREPAGAGVVVTFGAIDKVSPRQRRDQARHLVTNATAPATQAAAPTTTSKLRGVRADTQTEAFLARWKTTHQQEALAKFDNQLARSMVKTAMDTQRADYLLSTLGTIAIQMRGGTPKTDFEAMAREHIPPKKFAALLARYTKLSDITPTLAAPPGWSAELGLPKND